MKKIATILAVIMVFAALPISAYAMESEPSEKTLVMFDHDHDGGECGPDCYVDLDIAST